MSVPHALARMLATALFALGGAASPSPAPSADLVEAARAGDLAQVKALLQAGADVNSKNRYGATALTYASEKGHIEVVRCLVENGADPNVRDTFYQQTPLAWSLENETDLISILLLERGADEVTMALLYGVRGNKIPLVKAALATGPIFDFDIQAALEIAQESGSEEMVSVLGKAEVKEASFIDLSPDQLAPFAGTYQTASVTDMNLFVSWPLPRRDGLGLMQHTIMGEMSGQIQGGSQTIEVSLADGGLNVKSSEMPAFSIKPISLTEFRSQHNERIGVTFFGRTGMTEGLVLTRGAAPLVFSKSAEEEWRVPGGDRGDSIDSPDPAPSASLNWPSFRGPHATGIADGQEVPTSWQVDKGVHLKWIAEVPGLAHSSPIVWGDRVFVTTAVSSDDDPSLSTGFYGSFDSVDEPTEHAWKVYCFDKSSGRLNWERTAGASVPLSRRHVKATQANSTPVTDGTRVIAVFPTAGMICYDFDGNLLWKQDLGGLESGWFYDSSHQWGFASSPIIHAGQVILQADIQGNPYIAAWDVETGRQIWKTQRDEVPTWSTPTVVSRGGRHELITNGTTIRGYDPDTGSERWRLGPNSEIIIATPVPAGDMVYVSAGYPPTRAVYAIRPGGHGDLSLPEGESSSQHIAWSNRRTGTYITTPLLYRGLLYLVHHNGRISVFNAASGEQVYRARVGGRGTFSGSPVAADGKIYLVTEEGDVYVLKAGTAYQELAVNEMGESLLATPAIADGMIFIRGRNRLFAIGE